MPGDRRRGPGPPACHSARSRPPPRPRPAATEEQRCSPRRHRAKRCTCFSGRAVTVLPWADRDREERDDDASGGRDGQASRGAGRRLGPGRVRAASGQGRGPPAGGLRAVWRPWSGCSPVRSRPPRPGAAAPTARSASAHWLDDAVGRRGVVLHDRALPRGRANIDHIAVVASGIWVIDTKHYRGRLERRDRQRVVRPPPRLFVAGRDQSRLVTSARRQQALVAEALVARSRRRSLVRAALCFTGAQVGLFARPFTLEGVLVTWPRAFARTLAAPGPLGPGERCAWRRVARAFPPSAAWDRYRAARSARRSRASTPPAAPPTGRPGPHPGGSGRAGARPTWRAPCAAACPGRSVPSLIIAMNTAPALPTSKKSRCHDHWKLPA